jgi:hypothetical protein
MLAVGFEWWIGWKLKERDADGRKKYMKTIFILHHDEPPSFLYVHFILEMNDSFL